MGPFHFARPCGGRGPKLRQSDEWNMLQSSYFFGASNVHELNIRGYPLIPLSNPGSQHVYRSKWGSMEKAQCLQSEGSPLPQPSCSGHELTMIMVYV